VFNCTPVPREDYWLGAPQPGNYRKILDTDERRYGGSSYNRQERVEALARILSRAAASPAAQAAPARGAVLRARTLIRHADAPFGRTGLEVPVLGFGAMQLGDPSIDEATAARVLHHVLDQGLALIDTARSYGLAEERIGRHLESRRGEFVLSTKVGYDIAGARDWTEDCVRGASMRRATGCAST
jgi:hypothetical protein